MAFAVRETCFFFRARHVHSARASSSGSSAASSTPKDSISSEGGASRGSSDYTATENGSKRRRSRSPSLSPTRSRSPPRPSQASPSASPRRSPRRPPHQSAAQEDGAGTRGTRPSIAYTLREAHTKSVGRDLADFYGRFRPLSEDASGHLFTALCTELRVSKVSIFLGLCINESPSNAVDAHAGVVLPEFPQ